MQTFQYIPQCEKHGSYFRSRMNQNEGGEHYDVGEQAETV